MHIELVHISKDFGDIHANRDISLVIEPGLIHGILGENGAGKSTLMKILSGYIAKTSGEIRINGTPLEYAGPGRAFSLGIGMLYQEPLDFPELSVLENFIAGREGRTPRTSASLFKRFFMQAGAYRKILLALSKKFGFETDPDALVKHLTVGERQQLEIIRLLSLGVRTLILDEPTTGISALQKERLFSAIRTLSKEGTNIILVSHKLEDVHALCHRVTVLRKGKVAGRAEAPFQTDELVNMMFGMIPEMPGKHAAQPGGMILSMENLSAKGGRTGLADCSAQVRKKEILGLAGLEGSGQGVFLRVAAGLVPFQKGKMFFLGEDAGNRKYHDFRAKGTVFLPSARMEEGLIPEMTISGHVALKGKSGKFFVNQKKADAIAREKIRNFRIMGSPETPSNALSGGNQQRLLLSFIPQNPVLLLLESPTRGLDMDLANWVWKYLRSLADAGTAVVFSSSDLDEIRAAADRIMVFYNGRVVLDCNATETDASALGYAISGKSLFDEKHVNREYRDAL